METIVLFADSKSIYKTLNCDVYDVERNALTCKSEMACVYHPPCRTWGRLRGLAKEHPGEHLLAVWSILRIWRYGGVLEHPAGSKLWSLMDLPLPGSGIDSKGGYSVSIDQHWFGHVCKKNTWLYIKGVDNASLPACPMNFNVITHCISSTRSNSRLREVSKNKRSYTPVKLAEWLIEIVELINYNNQKHVMQHKNAKTCCKT